VIKPGVSEKEVFYRLEKHVRAKDCGFSFEPIIASGVNSCSPHAKITDRKIRNNESVLVDFGIDYKGYKSDLTRMFFLGRIPKLVKEIEGIVRHAQYISINIIKAGIKVSEPDKLVRNYFQEHKLLKYFGHSLGHGVGLDIHENPRLSYKNSTILKAGMVVTVEPGIYLPNKFGIRIEDMVLVTEKGCKVLSDNIN